jgi:hypothetical protein
MHVRGVQICIVPPSGGALHAPARVPWRQSLSDVQVGTQKRVRREPPSAGRVSSPSTHVLPLGQSAAVQSTVHAFCCTTTLPR